MFDNYIEKLDELIYSHTGPGKSIVGTDISELTLPGDNYCSLMLKIDVTLKNLENNEKEVLHVVAKCRNQRGSSFMDHISPLQFKKEIGFYTEVIPALEKFQREQGVEEIYDIFPKVLAFRKNLHGIDDEIDEHAVILMENLIEQGYSNIERQLGFDLEGAKRVLTDIAAFHAVPVALKLCKPDIFESTIKKYASLTKEFLDFTPPEDPGKPIFIKIAEEIEECKPYTSMVNQLYLESFKTNSYWNKPCIEPFASIVHCDMWVNNTMQIIKNGKIEKNKIIDFQIYLYGNPLLDVIFFLFSSVQRKAIKENLEDLLLLYQECFFTVLENLKCDTSCLQKNFLEQANDDAPLELIHLLFMTIPVFGRKEECTIDYEANPLDMLKESSVTQDARDHICHVLTEFGKRGWIRE